MYYSLAAARASADGKQSIYPAWCSQCECDTLDFAEPTCAKLCKDSKTGEETAVPCPPSNCTPRCDTPTCGPCTQTC